MPELPAIFFICAFTQKVVSTPKAVRDLKSVRAKRNRLSRLTLFFHWVVSSCDAYCSARDWMLVRSGNTATYVWVFCSMSIASGLTAVNRNDTPPGASERNTYGLYWRRAQTN